MFFFISCQYVLIAVCNWIYTKQFVTHYEISLLKFFLITLSVGFFPTVFSLLLLDRKILRGERVDRTEHVQSNKQQDLEFVPKEKNFILGHGTNKLILPCEDFIFAKAAGNYIEIYYLRLNRVRKELVRSSLTKLEHKINPCQRIVRCHRSYIVNLKFASKLAGRSRDLKIVIGLLKYKIPVSRRLSSATRILMIK